MIAVSWEFECDVLGCEETLVLTGLSTFASARREAKEHNWWSDSSGDCRCPTHRSFEAPVVEEPSEDEAYVRMWGRR